MKVIGVIELLSDMIQDKYQVLPCYVVVSSLQLDPHLHALQN